MPSSFISSSRRNPCPVCSKTNGNCRTVNDGDKDLVLCMTYIDCDGDNSLYRYIKPSGGEQSGLWGIHGIRDDRDYDRSEWERKKAEREEREILQERQRLEKCLSPEQRDSETRKVLAQLGLTDGDRRYLLGRGVPLPVIERCRSISQWQELNNPVHVNLPGVSKYGNRLNNPSDGILVAIPDGDGNLSAMRIHDRHDKNKKYSWLSSRSRGVDSRLPNNEYPIGYYSPVTVKESNRVGMCEGLEFKAPVAAITLGFPVVGFSGCQFASAMKQVKILANDKIITMIPDAGAVKNKHVKRALIDSIYRLESEGYSVEIAWWDQYNKADGDIDEIDIDTEIRFLTTTEFFALSETEKKPKNQFHQAFINLSNKLFGGIDGIKKTAKRLKTGLIKSRVDHYYKKGEGAKTYQDLVRAGYRYILDNSATGTGKTHTVSQLNRGACFLVPDDDDLMTKLVYCPPSHRNPTNSLIESDWFETVARNNGYFINYGKQTDLGNPYRESLNGLEVDDHERTSSNCHWAEKFHKYYAAGRDTKGLCGACELREKCSVKKGNGYGYISESKKWVAEPLIRTSTQWLDAEKLAIGLTGLILDEAGQVQWTIARKIDLLDIFSLMDVIRKSNRDLHKKLVDIEYGIRDLIGEKVPHHGYETKQVLERIGLDKSLQDDFAAIAAIEAENGGDSDKVKPVFLTDLVQILLGLISGGLTLNEKTLTISIRNHRLTQACRAAKWVICQDATWSRQHMAMSLGIEESEIYVICQEPDKVTNLTIEQWSGVGILGNNRSEVAQNRVKTMREIMIDMWTERVGFIDWKRYGRASDLVHCGDSRGSNAYKDKEIVVSFGLSRPNMGAIRLEYETLTGHVIDNLNNPNFSQFYNHVVAANLVQEIGRLRANRRPGQSLRFVLVGDGDISFLEEIGFDLVQVNAAEKFPGLDLGWKGAKARYINLAMRFCRNMKAEEWLELTMQQCADLFERVISSVSKFIKRWFGVEGDKKGIAFERFKSLVYAAIHNDKGNHKPLSEEDESMVNTASEMLSKVHYSGAELGQDLQMIIEWLGWDLFIESVKRLKYDYGIKLISRIFAVAIESEIT